MNIATIAGIVVTLTLLFGAGFGWLMGTASRLVNEKDEIAEKEKSVYSPATTKGFKIPVKESFEEQIKTARQLAAKNAAALPRGANMRISGNTGDVDLATAFQATDSDPLTAAKIAEFHGWQGVNTGMTSGAVAGAAPGIVGGAAPTKSIKDLKPGVDYEYTNYSKLKGAEKRQVIIANSKAKSAAIKALKAGGAVAGGVAAAPVAGTAQPAAAQPTAAAPVATGGTITRDLVPGEDYPYIEITDGMDPAEKRKATIANSKARSAAMKALKASGALEVAAPAPVVAAAAPVAAAPVVAATPSNAPPPPNYVEITDDMDPAEARKAKIGNSKLRSAYNKELKALGIDPKSLE
jgi:hypothetical protein